MTARTPSLPAGTSFVVWDVPLRLFHWLLVGSIAVSFLSSDEDSALTGWHIASGWVAAVLIVFRLAWGFAGGEHARFMNFVRPSQALAHLKGLASGRAERTVGHNPAGGMAVLLMLGGIAAVIATGWLTLLGGEEDLHETIAWLLLGLVGVHVAAVIATSVLSRENLVRAMVTGRKKTADHPGIRAARRGGPVALLIALGLSGAAVAGIRMVDPKAFSLQPREGVERERGEAGEGSQAEEREERGSGKQEEDRD